MVCLKALVPLLFLIYFTDISVTAQVKGTTIQGQALEEVEIEIERGEDEPLLDFVSSCVFLFKELQPMPARQIQILLS